jgi:hypothetical protein
MNWISDSVVLKHVRSLALASALALTAGANAAVVSWATSDGGNGNYYELLPGSYTVEEAYQIQTVMTYNGLAGHLIATETPAETDFLRGLLLNAGAKRAHIAASDFGHEGKWLWMAGPSTGQPLYFANGQYPWVYYQPDNYGPWPGGQNWAHAFIADDLGLPLGGMVLGNLYWDDAGYTEFRSSIVIEYENVAPVPLPGALGLLGTGLASLLYCSRRYRRKEGLG